MSITLISEGLRVGIETERNTVPMMGRSTSNGMRLSSPDCVAARVRGELAAWRRSPRSFAHTASARRSRCQPGESGVRAEVFSPRGGPNRPARSPPPPAHAAFGPDVGLGGGVTRAPHGRSAGVVSSAIGFLQTAGGALTGYLVGHFYNGTPLSLAVIVALFAGLTYLAHER